MKAKQEAYDVVSSNRSNSINASTEEVTEKFLNDLEIISKQKK